MKYSTIHVIDHQTAKIVITGLLSYVNKELVISDMSKEEKDLIFDMIWNYINILDSSFQTNQMPLD